MVFGKLHFPTLISSHKPFVFSLLSSWKEGVIQQLWWAPSIQAESESHTGIHRHLHKSLQDSISSHQQTQVFSQGASLVCRSLSCLEHLLWTNTQAASIYTVYAGYLSHPGYIAHSPVRIKRISHHILPHVGIFSTLQQVSNMRERWELLTSLCYYCTVLDGF